MILKQGSKVKLNIAKDLQTMISNKLFCHSNPLGPMIREILGFLLCPPIKYVIWQPFCFHNKAKITLRQAFLAIYILYKSDRASCNILNFRTYQQFSSNRQWRPCYFLKWVQNFLQTCFHSHKHSLHM